MKIVVTQEHINSGIKTYCSACPVALAISDAQSESVWVERNWAHVGSKSVDLPFTARRFIHDYDRGQPVKPFTFDLPI